MAADGNSQVVVLVERDSFRRTRPSVAEDRGLADKFGLGLLLANVRFAPRADLPDGSAFDPGTDIEPRF
jgi:hypothetical protein